MNEPAVSPVTDAPTTTGPVASAAVTADETPLDDAAARVRDAVAVARTGLVDREPVAELTVLGAVAGEHLLVVGPPGTGKSEAVRRVAGELGGRYFEYLVGRFTEPNEIFGPVDLRRLRDGVVEIETAGMLPEADIAFLDEVFLGSSAILNTLLGVLNERTFRRGRSTLRCPLRVCVGATNALPDDPALAAFADRFLVRQFVEPIPDSRLDELLEVGWGGRAVAAATAPGAGSATTPDGTTTPGSATTTAGPAADRPATTGGPAVDDTGHGLLPALDTLAAAAKTCDLSAVQPTIAVALRRLRAAGIVLSDRRAVRSQRLVAAAAAVAARRHATAEDLWVLPAVIPTADQQATAREVLSDLLGEAGSASLAHVAERLAQGPRARAERLAATARELLTELGDRPVAGGDRLRIEAVLRELDAGFDQARLPESLAGLRPQLVAAVE